MLSLLYNRVDDDAALRAKVDEAINVYDEYMKSKGGEGEAADAAKQSKEAGKDSKSEETKS